MDYVRYEHHGDRVAIVTLNRPERLNAFGSQMRTEFEEALQAAARDDAVRAVVVAGAGRAFCAGADIKEWAARAASPLAGTPDAATDAAPDAAVANAYGTADLIKPMVAAVHGYCLGAGLNLVATRCDLRVAGESARFGMPEVERGTISLTVPFALEGLPRAFVSELLLLGEVVSAKRAYQVGLVNAVVPDDEVLPAALRMAERLARLSPTAVQATKLNYLKTFEATASAVEWQRRIRERTSASAETREGMAAFVERRPPDWDRAGT